jgi:GNAT superfamily N-acetyltransferase
VGGEIGISLREFDASIAEAYERLFPGDPDKSAELLNWRFQENPHGKARFAVAEHGGRVVGMIALVATRLCNAPGRGLGYQAIDTSVDPAFRGRGLFVQMGALAQDARALGGEILWGFPNANAAPGWYRRLDWTNFGAVPLLMRPLRTSYLLGRVHPRLAAIDLPLVRGRKLVSEVYADGDRLAQDFEGLWRRAAPQLGIAVERAGEWMRWRLFDKPQANYRCVGMKASSGELDAFVALKVADKHGGRLCYLMEALAAPGHERDLARLLQQELALAARSGAELALAWCPKAAPNHRVYRKAGFFPVPQRFRPIEINFGARALVEETAAAAAPGSPWYISYLDSDTN